MNDHSPIQAEERPSVAPICPHCEARLHTVWYRAVSGFLGKRYLYFCPTCQKVLGVTHRKGFWMG